MSKNSLSSFSLLLIGLGVLVLVLFFLSLSMGDVWINPLSSLSSSQEVQKCAERLILWQIRLPRAILGLAIGAILGLSGAVLQGLLRNPLAEPGLLGVSASASFGAVLSIHIGLGSLFAYALPLSALGTALISVMLLMVIAGRSTDTLVLILSGIALSSLASALTSLVLNLSANPYAAMEIVFWMMGSLTDRSLVHVELALPLIVLGGAMLFLTGRALDALSLGHDVARSLGINLRSTYFLAIVGTAVGVGAATAVCGAISFVGLVVPHLLRPLVGARPSRLLPVSALGGACFLMAADIAIRMIVPDRDLKLGVVTALIGAPFFFWLLFKVRRGHPS